MVAARFQVTGLSAATVGRMRALCGASRPATESGAEASIDVESLDGVGAAAEALPWAGAPAGVTTGAGACGLTGNPIATCSLGAGLKATRIDGVANQSPSVSTTSKPMAVSATRVRLARPFEALVETYGKKPSRSGWLPETPFICPDRSRCAVLSASLMRLMPVCKPQIGREHV